MKKIFIILLLTCSALAAQTTQTQCTNAIATPSVQLTSGLTTPTYIDSSPVDGTMYGYVVIAINGMGQYSCSNILTNVLIPTTGTNTVTLTWNASTTSGVTYSVFRAQTPTSPTGLAATVN